MSAELTTPIKIEIPGIGTIESADLYLKYEADAAIAEIKDKLDKAIAERDGNQVCLDAINKKLEDVQATAYAESVDAGMRERKLKRSLWLARAERAKAMKAIENLDNYLSLHKNSKWFGIYATRIDTWFYKWDNVERKCLKKAEEYK